jgi:hypothetical protein
VCTFLQQLLKRYCNPTAYEDLISDKHNDEKRSELYPQASYRSLIRIKNHHKGIILKAAIDELEHRKISSEQVAILISVCSLIISVFAIIKR